MNYFREQRQSSCKHHQTSVLGSNGLDGVQTSELHVILNSGRCHGIINSYLLWVVGPQCHMAGGIASWYLAVTSVPMPLSPGKKGSFINTNVNRARVELDVSEHPGVTSGSQASSTEFSRAKSQLASYSWHGKHSMSRCVQKSFSGHDASAEKLLEPCPPLSKWCFLGFLPHQGEVFQLPHQSLSIHSQFSESPESLSSWLVFLSSSLQFKCLLSLLLQSWGQIFLLITGLVSQSRGVVCVRAGGGQDKHFRERGLGCSMWLIIL